MNKKMKQFEVLNWASSFLNKYNRETNIAELLLRHHKQIGRTTFFAEMREIVPKEVLDAYKKDIELHAVTGVPVQHLMGYAPFYGLDFLVNEHVLIPRFETEELVEHASRYLSEQPDHEKLIVADLGTGSGVIAITLKKLFPELMMYATDISESALNIAKQNAMRMDADVHFMQGDFLIPLLEEDIQPAVILSNPPYIGRHEAASLQDTVKNFDPEIALFAEEEGLQAYRTILSQVAELPDPVLRALFFEIGATQGEAISDIIQAFFPEGTLEVIKDVHEKDRIVVKKR